mgnify:CR=1 FL=1
MNPAKYRYIVVEGPIGVGKTSLARRIAAETGAQALLEQPQDNPFLERFYRDSTRYALPTQMFFLFQRMNQLRDLAQTDMFSAPVVSDFLLDKDPIFAALTLADDELNLYRQMFDHFSQSAPRPDLVIYLQAAPSTLSERIRLVLDNLSTHSAGALYQAFPADEARRVLRRLEFHYVPKHASWLNMVEIEIGVLRSQCLDRRIDNRERLASEIAAWERQRNASGARIKWMFTTDKARAKMGRAYPQPVSLRQG